MQEEIEHKTVNLAISTTKLSARTLLRGMQFLLRQYDKHASQGKQSMKRLVRQNRGVTNVEIQKTGIKDFDRYAKRYHIDYSIQKDLSCKPPRYLIYFKAQDTDALNAAFKEYSASVLDKTKRPSVLAKLHDLAQSVANLKGSKEDCQWIKSKLSEFIGQTLKMELSEEKTLITHSSECARFLGFDVRVRRCEKVKRNKKGTKARTLNNHVELRVPFDDKIHNFIFSKGIAIQKKDGKLFPVHRNSLLRLTDLEIVTVYNDELRGICNYYGIASNFCKLKYLSYLMEYSCLKTLAAKHKSKISKVVAMYKDGTGEWGIPYETKKKAKRRYFANYMDCKDAKISTDCISNAAIIYGQSVTPLEKRLKARICELCGTTESERYEIHHINKLKNLKGKEPWEIAMLAKRRKTLVVCEHCHHLIHNQ